ncbi:MAG: stage II sporulation protein M [Clostridia bacterium]|nr:stage II sporulation protein M [Clostridia bacterium]
MRRKRRSAGRAGSFGFFRAHYQIISIAALIVAGMLIGALLARQAAASGQNNFGSVLKASFSAQTASQGFVSLMLSSFLSSSLLLLAAYLCGLCAAGLPVLVVLPLFKGAGLGFSIGYLYIQYGLRGMTLAALCILPEGLIVCIALILACRAGMRYSYRLACTILPTGKQYSLWSDFVSFSCCCLACLGLDLAASILEALIITGLHGYLF